MNASRLICLGLGFLLAACSSDASNNEVKDVPDVTKTDLADLSGADNVQGDLGGDLTADLAEEVVEPNPEHGFCEPNNDPLPQRPEIAEPATLPRLHVDGLDIVDDEGNPVALRGFNFGGWLVIEYWINGFVDPLEEDLLAELEKRAKNLGLVELLNKAKALNGLDWIWEKKTHWDCIQEWRIHMHQNASTELLPKVEELWAWFDSQPYLKEEQSIWLWLEKKFGYKKAWDLRQVYHDNYITERDFEMLADMGMNLVRLPIFYQNLETDFVGDNHYRLEGWERLHQAALWARKHNLYLMVDLHGAPGGQSACDHQGLRSGGKALWENEGCQEQAARVWKALANFFKDDPHVFAYDLLNEPMTVPDRERFETVHKMMYAAIREVDPDTIVAVGDGYRPAEDIASPKEMGMENAIFAFHFYPWGVQNAQDYMTGSIGSINFYLNLFERYQCPLVASEFSASAGTYGPWVYEATDEMLALLNRRGIHWTLWSWKFMDESNIWGMLNPKGDTVSVMPMKGTSDEIKTAFEATNTENYETFPEYEAAVRARAKDEAVPLNPALIDAVTWQ